MLLTFCVYLKKLVIEVDGSQHYTEYGIECDRKRTDLLKSLGLHVMRFSNAEIDTSFIATMSH